MDLHAVKNMSSGVGSSRGVGCLRASERKLLVIGDKDRLLSSTYRLLQVRAAGTGRKGNNNKNNNNGDHDPSSGNSEDQMNQFFGKSRRETSKITNLDWRTFRANLVAQEQMNVEGFNIGEHHKPPYKPSRRLGSKWAHPLTMPETGCILVATERLDGIREFERSVILLLSSGTTDSRESPFGVILNQPLDKNMRYWKAISGKSASIFSRCCIHFGGPLDDSIFLLRSDMFPQIRSFKQVIPGTCYGTIDSIDEAAELIMEGVLKPQDFRFFLGYAGWQLDQLRDEIESGYWVVAACSADLISHTSPMSSSGLWEEILQLMGGPYAELSKKPKEENPE